MDGKALITHNGKIKFFSLSPLEAASISAARAGYVDVDVQDNDPGNYTIVASGANVTLTANGKTMVKAVENLLDKLGWGDK